MNTKKGEVIAYDDKDKIIFSKSFNVYENKLIIPNLLDFKFEFIFEKKDPKKDQKDVLVQKGENKEIIITFSKKFRNSLGSSTSKKISILKINSDKKILFSVFGQQIGDGDCLHITVSFYLR